MKNRLEITTVHSTAFNRYPTIAFINIFWYKNNFWFSLFSENSVSRLEMTIRIHSTGRKNNIRNVEWNSGRAMISAENIYRMSFYVWMKLKLVIKYQLISPNTYTNDEAIDDKLETVFAGFHPSDEMMWIHLFTKSFKWLNRIECECGKKTHRFNSIPQEWCLVNNNDNKWIIIFHW